jgi:hypothetical protein
MPDIPGKEISCVEKVSIDKNANISIRTADHRSCHVKVVGNLENIQFTMAEGNLKIHYLVGSKGKTIVESGSAKIEDFTTTRAGWLSKGETTKIQVPPNTTVSFF